MFIIIFYNAQKFKKSDNTVPFFIKLKLSLLNLVKTGECTDASC